MRRKSSTNDHGRNHPYLYNVPEVEWQKAKIKRIKTKAGEQVIILRDGVETYNSNVR